MYTNSIAPSKNVHVILLWTKTWYPELHIASRGSSIQWYHYCLKRISDLTCDSAGIGWAGCAATTLNRSCWAPQSGGRAETSTSWRRNLSSLVRPSHWDERDVYMCVTPGCFVACCRLVGLGPRTQKRIPLFALHVWLTKHLLTQRWRMSHFEFQVPG